MAHRSSYCCPSSSNSTLVHVGSCLLCERRQCRFFLMHLQFHTFLFVNVAISVNWSKSEDIGARAHGAWLKGRRRPGSLELQVQNTKGAAAMTAAASQKHQAPSWIEDSTWIYCVKCRTYPGSEAGGGRRPYFVTDCGHIYCSQCRVNGQSLASSKYMPVLNIYVVHAL